MAVASQQAVSPRTLLRLGRVSNLPTVWTNVLAATVLAGGAWQNARTGLVLLAMSLFYVGGMYLNDYFDRTIDARERPERPIPAGDISANAVAAAGFGMLGAGIVLLAATGVAAAVTGLILAALIVAYNLFHKGVALSPVTMGLCRAFVYFGAAAAVSGGVPWPVVLVGFALTAYVAGLTYAARQESLDRVGNLWPLVLLCRPDACSRCSRCSRTHAAIVIYLALIGWTAYAVYLLAKRPMPGAVPRAVGALIAGISLVDATFLAGIGAIMPALRRGRRLRRDHAAATLHRGDVSMNPCADILLGALSRVLAPDALAWLTAEIDRQRAAADERRLAIALGLASRKIARVELSLDPDEAATARQLRAGWQPELWSADEAARVLILGASHGGDDQAFAARVDRLCTTAEVTEYIAYLKGFAIFPAPKLLYGRAREGVRSAITPVFAAIACHNPYPFDHFDEEAWNQMVVKAVFNGVPIETIVGLRERRNPEVVQMMRDLVSERHAAGRPLAGCRSRLCGSQLTVRGDDGRDDQSLEATRLLRGAERGDVAARVGDGTGGERCAARRADVSALLHRMSRRGWTRRRQELHAARGRADAQGIHRSPGGQLSAGHRCGRWRGLRQERLHAVVQDDAVEPGHRRRDRLRPDLSLVLASTL